MCAIIMICAYDVHHHYIKHFCCIEMCVCFARVPAYEHARARVHEYVCVCVFMYVYA